MQRQIAEIFSLSPFIVACIVALLIGIVEFGMFMQLPLWVLPLLYIFWISSNYFLEIVEYKALGHQDWPVFLLETLVAGRNQAGVLFFLLVTGVAFVCIALRYWAMDSTARTLFVLGLAVLPAIAGLLAVTREFRSALNPLKILAAATNMGPGYLLCLLAVAVLVAVSALAEARREMYWYPLPPYALFLLAWVTGTVIYSRRHALGVNAPKSPEVLAERALAQTIATRNRILSIAYGFATRGNRAGALKYVEGYIATDEDTPEARLWMFNEMTRWEDNAVPLEFGRRVIDYCEQHGLFDQAALVRRQSEHLDGRRQGL